MSIEAVFRREYGRCVATLIRFLGDIDAAEEAVQDAFTVAVARWPADGQPPNPGAWIVTTARNRAIDRLRRESVRDERHAQAHHLYGADTSGSAAPREEETVPDDRLRLIFTCCHPALNQAAQVALTLRLLGGLGTPEIAFVRPARNGPMLRHRNSEKSFACDAGVWACPAGSVTVAAIATARRRSSRLNRSADPRRWASRCGRH